MWITATQPIFHKTSDPTIYNIVKLRVEVKSAISSKIVLSVLFYCYSDKQTPSELASLRAGLRLDAWPVEPVHKTFGNVWVGSLVAKPRSWPWNTKHVQNTNCKNLAFAARKSVNILYTHRTNEWRTSPTAPPQRDRKRASAQKRDSWDCSLSPACSEQPYSAEIYPAKRQDKDAQIKSCQEPNENL